MRRLLLVDAAPAVLALRQQALRQHRGEWHTVATASIAAAMAAAMASLAHERFDAIVTEFGMPAMDGPKFLAQVGVETELQRRQLTALGATLFQGYLYGKPMALAEIDPWFLSSAFAAAPSELPDADVAIVTHAAAAGVPPC